MTQSGMPLLQGVAERVLARWLTLQGRQDVRRQSGAFSSGGRSVDLTYTWQGGRRRITVKPDPYCGTDPDLIADRSLTFYRADAAAFGLEAIANAATREPGWAVDSEADDIYYYFLALAQPEDVVAVLMSEPDEVFFAELEVGRDDLVVIPAQSLKKWFEANSAHYTSRPVVSGGTSAWYRMVPRADLEKGVAGITRPGSIFRAPSR